MLLVSAIASVLIPCDTSDGCSIHEPHARRQSDHKWFFTQLYETFWGLVLERLGNPESIPQFRSGGYGLYCFSRRTADSRHIRDGYRLDDDRALLTVVRIVPFRFHDVGRRHDTAAVEVLLGML
jgi:hypothetical protein